MIYEMKVVTPQRLEEEEEEGGSGSLAKVNVLEYVKKNKRIEELLPILIILHFAFDDFYNN